MREDYLKDMFNIKNKVVVITGGGGVLCSALSRGLASAGAMVAVLDILDDAAKKVTELILSEGGRAVPICCNVLDKTSVEKAAEVVLQTYARVDILINGAGGNKPQATTSPEFTFFDLPVDAIRGVFDLNFIGSILSSQVFGKFMAEQGEGIILNIASMNAFRPLTRIPAYSAAKAALTNFTQWLAVHMAQEYSPRIRVNAIAPGFLFTEQNRFLLTEAITGELTLRGKRIIEHTPLGRFQTPDDLLSTVIWLISPGSCAVTGIVVPVDGGFSAYSGV